jgi:hypothetical protein
VDLARPPVGKWEELVSGPEQNGGYLFVYYSDDLSPLAVRAVTKLGDNKSDPNIETGTFGLFSTCGRSTRAGMVKRCYPWLFFLSQCNGERALTGYYRVRWYTHGAFVGAGDVALAADKMHWVRPGIPLADLADIPDLNPTRRFRGCRLVTPQQAQLLRSRLDERPDESAAYIREVHRLEQFNRAHGRYQYIGWRQDHPFTWEWAGAYLMPHSKAKDGSGRQNSSASGWWACSECDALVQNQSLLKRCPICGAIGSLTAHGAPA